MDDELGVNEEQIEDVEQEGEPVATETTPETPAPVTPPVQPAMDPLQLMWMQQQQMLQQMQQLQEHNAYLAAQIQARQVPSTPQVEEEEPDINIEPEKYLEWWKRKQFAPIQAQIQDLQQQQTHNQVVERANELIRDPRFADYQQYYQTILQMAQNVPMSELAKPGSLELLYYTAKGIHAGQTPAQAAQSAQAQANAPAANRASPPPIVGSGTVGTTAKASKVTLTAEEKRAAKIAGISEAEYAKYKD